MEAGPFEFVNEENRGTGDLVGTFQAQDPDGDTLTPSSRPVDQVMETIRCFATETNGTLRTAMELV